MAGHLVRPGSIYSLFVSQNSLYFPSRNLTKNLILVRYLPNWCDPTSSTAHVRKNKPAIMRMINVPYERVTQEIVRSLYPVERRLLYSLLL